jgi:hypothetical protein
MLNLLSTGTALPLSFYQTEEVLFLDFDHKYLIWRCNHIVTCLLKARIVNPGEAAIARE